MMQRLTLTILETSDLHGNILPINYGNNQLTEVGIAKVATIIKEEKKKHPTSTLIIDNGDLIQGTPLSYYYARFESQELNPLISALNKINYDAAVIGNHEFNYGQDVLLKSMEDSQFPWLSCNIVNKETKKPFYGKPYIIKELAEGLRVGVLGLTTHYIPNWENPEHIKELHFEDAVEAAKKWVRYIRDEEKVDVMIVSYHGGFEKDLDTGEATEHLTGENQGYQLCHEVEGIDVLLTGHQHRSIAGKMINGVIVVQPSHQGREVGKVNVEVERNDNNDSWVIVAKSSELIPVTAEVEVDQEIIDMTSTFETKTQAWLDKPIGHIKGDMLVSDAMALRLKDNPLIEFINHVQMVTANVDISNTALFDNISPGLKSDVTMRDVVSNYIYPNTLKVLRITGKDIKEALERSASYFAEYNGEKIEINPTFSKPKPQHYNYDMWEGIEYKINISKPIGERIVSLTRNGEPISPEKEYDVVMNNYRAGGGGDYLMYKDKPVILDIPIDVSELIANYILEKGTIEATINHNWEVIHD
jgi:2',3'-cyclic-nucleotide 2'-phosphodiesterase / 3'-nucleotidase